MTITHVIEEVQRQTGCTFDVAVYAAAVAWPHVPETRDDGERHRLLLAFILAGSEPQPWAAA